MLNFPLGITCFMDEQGNSDDLHGFKTAKITQRPTNFVNNGTQRVSEERSYDAESKILWVGSYDYSFGTQPWRSSYPIVWGIRASEYNEPKCPSILELLDSMGVKPRTKSANVTIEPNVKGAE